MRVFSLAAHAVVLCLVFLGPALSAPITALQEFSAVLPSGEGKILVLKYCVGCHGVRVARVYLEKGRAFDMEGWEGTMEEEEVGPIASYLEENFDPEAKQAPSEKAAGLEALLTPGEQKEVILGNCLSCHDPEVMRRSLEARAGLPASAWKELLLRMKAYGTALTDGEVGQLSDYLDWGLGSNSALVDQSRVRELASFLPDGPGKDLVMAHCLSCHGAPELRKRIEERPGEDRGYWDAVVRRMKDRWQMTLEEEDVSATIEYLNSHFSW